MMTLKQSQLYIHYVATDNKDSIYVRVKYKKKTGSEEFEEFVVYQFSNTADLLHKFPVSGRNWYRLTVTNSQVLELGHSSVAVYDTDGFFVRLFGKGPMEVVCDITAANVARVIVEDWDWINSCCHIFGEYGDHLNEFKLQESYDHPRIAFHWSSEHVIAGKEEPLIDPCALRAEIFTKNGEFVRWTHIHGERIYGIGEMTVTKDKRIALLQLDIIANTRYLLYKTLKVI